MALPAINMINLDSKVSSLNPEQLTDLQSKLKSLGYYMSAVDGEYGINTARAWKQFKKDNFLSHPLIIGVESYSLLSSLVKSKPKGDPIENIIKVAKAELGVTESPFGSNRQKYGKWYGMNGVPWCAIFVSWVFNKAGYPLPIIQDGAPSGGAYCPYFELYAKRKKQWHKTPRRGDMALFHFGKREAVHIGIVDTVMGSQFLCLEGNTSGSSNDNGGAVMRRTRSLTQCRGFYRPALAPPATGFEAYYRVLKLANPLMQGNDVKEWQKQMNKKGYSLEVDGYYGNNSVKACKDFQGKNKLESDGQVGPLTWRVLFNE